MAGSGFDYDDFERLFEDKHAQSLIQRQRDAVDELLDCNRRGGFYVCELDRVASALLLLADRISDGHSVLIDDLCRLLDLSTPSYRTVAANEEETHRDCMTALLRAIGDLLDAGEPRVELAAAEALFRFLRGSPSPQLDSGSSELGTYSSSAAEIPGLGLASAERAEMAEAEVRAPGSTHPTKWERALSLACSSGAVKRVCRALRREVRELAQADTDGDGGVDVAEFLRFRALNDGDAANDGDTLEQLARAQGSTENGDGDTGGQLARAGGRPGTAGTDAGGSAGAAHRSGEYFLAVIIRVVLELSEGPEAAAALSAGGAPGSLVRVVHLVHDWRDAVVQSAMEAMWNLCEHSASRATQGTALSLGALLRKHRAHNACYQLATLPAARALARLFARSLAGAVSEKDKALRNDVLVLLLTLARSPVPPRRRTRVPPGAAAAHRPRSSHVSRRDRAAHDGATPDVSVELSGGAAVEGGSSSLSVPPPMPGTEAEYEAARAGAGAGGAPRSGESSPAMGPSGAGTPVGSLGGWRAGVPASQLRATETALAQATGEGAAAELAKVSDAAQGGEGWEAPSGPGSSATGDGHASLAAKSGLLTLVLHVCSACEAGLEGTDMPVAGFEGVMQDEDEQEQERERAEERSSAGMGVVPPLGGQGPQEQEGFGLSLTPTGGRGNSPTAGGAGGLATMGSAGRAADAACMLAAWAQEQEVWHEGTVRAELAGTRARRQGLAVPRLEGRRGGTGEFWTSSPADLQAKSLCWALAVECVQQEQDALRAAARLREAERELAAATGTGEEQPAIGSGPGNKGTDGDADAEGMPSPPTHNPGATDGDGDGGTPQQQGVDRGGEDLGGDAGARDAGFGGLDEGKQAGGGEQGMLAGTMASEAFGQEDLGAAPLDPQDVPEAEGGPVLETVRKSLLLHGLLTHLETPAEGPQDSDEEDEDEETRFGMVGNGGRQQEGKGDDTLALSRPSTSGASQGLGQGMLGHPYLLSLSAGARRRLQLHALSCLHSLAPLSMRGFVEAGGPAHCLQHLYHWAAPLRRAAQALREGAQEEARVAAQAAAREGEGEAEAAVLAATAAALSLSMAAGAGAGRASGAGARVAARRGSGGLRMAVSYAALADLPRVHMCVRLLQRCCQTPAGGPAVARYIGMDGACAMAADVAMGAFALVAGPRAGRVPKGGLDLRGIPASAVALESEIAGDSGSLPGPECGGTVPPSLLLEASLSLGEALCAPGRSDPSVDPAGHATAKALAEQELAGAAHAEPLAGCQAWMRRSGGVRAAVRVLRWDAARRTRAASRARGGAMRAGASAAREARGHDALLQSTATGLVADVAPSAGAAARQGGGGAAQEDGPEQGPGGAGSAEDPSAAAAPRPALAAVALLRAATARSRRGVARALAEGAADALLDEAEGAPPALAAACLGCLADLVREHPAAALPHLKAWCSDSDGAPALAVLTRLWRSEETRLGVARGPHGEIDLGSFPDSMHRPLSVGTGNGSGAGAAGSATPSLGGTGVGAGGTRTGFALTSGGGGGGGVGGGAGGVGSAFGRLRDALRASKLWAAADGGKAGANGPDGTKSGPEQQGRAGTRAAGVRAAAEALALRSGAGSGLRAAVWAVLHECMEGEVRTGALGDVGGLPLSDRVALEAAMSMPRLVEAEAWWGVEHALRGPFLPEHLRVQPTAEDEETLRAALGRAEEAVRSVAEAQAAVVEATSVAIARQDERFQEQVLNRKQCTEDGAALSLRGRRAPVPALTGSERRAAKARRRAMLEAAERPVGVRPFKAGDGVPELDVGQVKAEMAAKKEAATMGGSRVL